MQNKCRLLIQQFRWSTSLAKAKFIIDGYVDTVSAVYKERFIRNEKLSKQFNDLLAQARAGGGERAIKRHTETNRKLIVQQRLKLLLDDKTEFLEVGAFAGWNMDYGDIPAAGSVMGIGSVSGKLCLIMVNDATVKGGTIYPIGVKKQLRGQEIAKMLRLPCIYIVDSGGAFLPLQSEIFPDSQHGGRVFYNQAVMGSEGISQIAVICGSCTAGAAYIPTMADNAIIVDKIGSVFLGGPPLVQAALGEIVTSEELGGATLHCRTSGCTDYFAVDEERAFSMCREVMENTNVPEYIRSNVEIMPKFSPMELKGLVGETEPSKSYIFSILARILDRSKFFEFRALYGEGLVAGFGKIGEHDVGIVAGVGSPIDSKSAQKACQFVEMCSQQKTPIIFFHNSMHDGWSATSERDNGNSLRNVAALIKAVACCDAPKISVIIGDSFGSDYFAMCGRSFDPIFVFAWPNSAIGFIKPGTSAPWMDSEPGNSSVTADETTSFYAASRLWIDAVILPEETRKVLKFSLDVINRPKNEQTVDRHCSNLRF